MSSPFTAASTDWVITPGQRYLSTSGRMPSLPAKSPVIRSSAAVECVISSRFLVMMPECEKGCGGVTAASTAAMRPPLPGLRMMSPFLAFMKRGGSMTCRVSLVGRQNMPSGTTSGRFHGSHSSPSTAFGGSARDMSSIARFASNAARRSERRTP